MMESETPISSVAELSAGELLRSYRLEQGVELTDLANLLRVSVAKLHALEDNHWEDLHDAMFVRSLALAVCRQLKTDAKDVLALLPQHDHSKLGEKNEKGLNSPLTRPSLLPQSAFVNFHLLFTPMRWSALGILLVALGIAVWPDVQPWLVFKETTEPPVQVLAPMPTEEHLEKNMVITNVQSAAVPLPAASPLVIQPAASASTGNSGADAQQTLTNNGSTGRNDAR